MGADMTFPQIPLAIPKATLPPPPAPITPQASPALPPVTMPPAAAPPVLAPKPTASLPPIPPKLPEKPPAKEGISLESAKRAQGIYVAEGQKKLRDKERPVQQSPTESRWGKA
jgi:hypothetical protein